MSFYVLIANMLFNLALMVSCAFERCWFWVLYWFGALVINTAVCLIRMKAEGKL